jgi:Zn-finger nucleic acid-binding protein
MLCPICKVNLKKEIFYGVEVDYCPLCLGMWFEENELRLAKDKKDKHLTWLDIDLWKDRRKFKIFLGERLCPAYRLPLYEVYYGDSRIIIDFCSLCKGVWLDRGEFKRIIEYLKEKADREVLKNYAKNLLEEAAEILIGPETLREEILDFLTVLKLLNYKLATQYPILTNLIYNLPR